MNQAERLWIIIPAFNEAVYIGKCLGSFANQSDSQFRIVLVDNASTDNTGEVAKQIAHKKGLMLDVIKEMHKGTGWACRAGFRFAINHGAKILARTDADCMPERNWISEILNESLHKN